LSLDAVKTHLRMLFRKPGIEHLPQNQKRARLAEWRCSTAWSRHTSCERGWASCRIHVSAAAAQPQSPVRRPPMPVLRSLRRPVRRQGGRTPHLGWLLPGDRVGEGEGNPHTRNFARRRDRCFQPSSATRTS
jgi:hypothetical protein